MAITIDVQDIGVAPNTTIPASSLILDTESDSDLDTITQYQFTDVGDEGHFTVNGVAQPANTPITVAAANLGTVQYVSGPAPVNDEISAAGAVRDVVGIRCGAFSGNMKVSFQAARSIG